jgi:hypothetical protein
MRDESVTNFGGCGSFVGDQTYLIDSVGVSISASSEHISSILKMNSVIELWIGDKLAFGVHSKLALVPETSASLFDLPDDGSKNPIGLLKLQNDIPIPPRQPFVARFLLSSPAENLARSLHTKVGPGSGWFEVTFFMLGTLTRPIY